MNIKRTLTTAGIAGTLILAGCGESGSPNDFAMCDAVARVTETNPDFAFVGMQPDDTQLDEYRLATKDGLDTVLRSFGELDTTDWETLGQNIAERCIELGWEEAAITENADDEADALAEHDDGLDSTTPEEAALQAEADAELESINAKLDADQAPTTCDVAREAFLTGTDADIAAALAALQADSTADAYARESAKSYLTAEENSIPLEEWQDTYEDSVIAGCMWTSP